MKNIFKYLPFLFLIGCAGFQKDCASSCASNLGADWIVVQYRFDGTAINCWKLSNTSISNEPGSDGIYWQDSNSGNLVHVSGWYNRVQISRGDFNSAAKLIDVDVNACSNGKYVAPVTH